VKQLRKYLQLAGEECSEKKAVMILLNKKDLMGKNYFEEAARKELQKLSEQFDCGQLKVVSALSSTQEELHTMMREFVKSIIKNDSTVYLPLSQATNAPSRLEQVMVRKREDKKEEKCC
jgi:predicted GTPase